MQPPSQARFVRAVLVGAVLLSACGGDEQHAGPAALSTVPPTRFATRLAATASPTAGAPSDGIPSSIPVTATVTPPRTGIPATPGTTITPACTSTTPIATATPTATHIDTDVVLTIDSVLAEPGQAVDVGVSLTAGDAVVGIQNDIELPSEAPIAATSAGGPDCAVNPAIDKSATSFAFQPFGCVPGTDCTAVRAIVISFSNIDVIPVGSVLYTCRVNVSLDAFSGPVYPLTCSMPGASDAGGFALPTTCEDGEVAIVVP